MRARALLGAVLAMAVGVPPVVPASDVEPSLEFPKAAYGNGSRGHRGNNKAFWRKVEQRRRKSKEAKRSRRRNRA